MKKRYILGAVGFVVIVNMALQKTDETVSEPYLAEGFSGKDAEGPQVVEESELQPDTQSESVGIRSMQDKEGRPLLLVEKGSFEMAFDGGAYRRPTGPLKTVNIRAFFMGETEVTYEEWSSVMEWAKLNGYKFDHAGIGKSAGHPVTDVSWYDSVKWCNAKSEMEGLRPCYYTSQAKTVVYRQGHAWLSSGMVAWGANGYRLPTKAEWEKAARGGLAGKRYPNGDTLELSDANFARRRDGEFDNGRGATKEVKLYPPNGYGLYDMAGNVAEWCWDSRPALHYDSSREGNIDDPKGPAVGKYRVFCGGGADDPKSHCQIGFYLENMENNHWGEYLGFRVVRR